VIGQCLLRGKTRPLHSTVLPYIPRRARYVRFVVAAMNATRVEARRQVAHALAVGVVLLGTFVCHAATQGAASDVDQPSTEGGLVQVASPAPVTAAPDPTQVPTAGHARFAPAVERWRSLSRDAARTVYDVTGVRLDEDMVLALVAVESEGKPAARSARGAVGLAQVEPTTFEDLRTRYGQLLAGRSLEQPGVNLLAGALYLADCARVLGANVADPGDLALVLHAYNMGPRAAAEWRETGSWLNQTERGAQLEHGLPAETIDHATRILAAINAARV
jgi:soluble lytic murein transglycosylase-like protein